MTALAAAIRAFEQTPVPDKLTLMGIAFLCGAAGRRLSRLPPETEGLFAVAMRDHTIAENTAEANAQHYELPAEFFTLALGPRRKYSCCLYDGVAPPSQDSLDRAEIRALEATVEHADIRDGQDVLELGCGWGSLSLWMAERFPGARIVSVSNSHSQRRFIEGEAAARGLTNLKVVTADMNRFDAAMLDEPRFDRVVSVEMFEHMANWPALLTRLRGWMKPDGRLFLHVFTHKTTPYSFDRKDDADWIAQHFFTGGVMPSHNLIHQFGSLFGVEREWRWSGEHYRRTAMDWLANFDRNHARIREILAEVYGRDARLWHRRWRLFFLSVAGLFGHDRGSEWGVSHYRLAPAPIGAND
jgi:cyclopropane-fatty-acyl-phospholipid synthase